MAKEKREQEEAQEAAKESEEVTPAASAAKPPQPQVSKETAAEEKPKRAGTRGRSGEADTGGEADTAAEEGGASSDAPESSPETPKRARRSRKSAGSEEGAAVEHAETRKPVAEGRRRRARDAGTGKTPSRTRARAASAVASGAELSNRTVVRAQAKYVRTSARKARIVCGHLRGKSVAEARAILAFTPRQVARDWSKLLDSAVANAENNHELLEEDLIVGEAYADEGPTIKRFRPRARGRASSIRKRTSHLTITLTPHR
jgi:large subunit ribosomal protein L22